MQTLEERFWAKVDTTAPNGCHEWTALITEKGYGRFRVHRQLLRAHRFAWELAHGRIPDGFEIDHLCGNRRCVNVAHLEVVRHRENVLRSATALAAVNARKTQCIRGHTLEDAYRYRKANGQVARKCRTCLREHRARLRAERQG